MPFYLNLCWFARCSRLAVVSQQALSAPLQFSILFHSHPSTHPCSILRARTICFSLLYWYFFFCPNRVLFNFSEFRPGCCATAKLGSLKVEETGKKIGVIQKKKKEENITYNTCAWRVIMRYLGPVHVYKSFFITDIYGFVG